MQTSYDILIVGGGIVGLTLACALAKQTSLSIAILEAKSSLPTWDAAHYSHRVSAIALSSQRIFRSLQIWENMRKKRVSPFTQIYVWDENGSGKISFDSKEIAEPLLGYIIENNVIQSVLAEKIKQCAQIEWISPIELDSFHTQEKSVELRAKDGRLFQAKLAVAADGAHSWLRSQAGILLDHYDYEQEAIVATVQTEHSHEHIARQVFLLTGPLAFLPLDQDNLSSIVWSLPSKEAKRLMTLELNHFKQELAKAFAHQLGEIVDVEQRYSFPLHKQQAKKYVAPHLALVGDAAHTIHPLAGQGVNMGLLDAVSLVEVITDAIRERRDFSSTTLLRRYERWRKADNFSLLNGVDVIKNVFDSDKKSVQRLRSFGLNTINRAQWIKNIFTRHAVGDRNGLPQLAR